MALVVAHPACMRDLCRGPGWCCLGREQSASLRYFRPASIVQYPRDSTLPSVGWRITSKSQQRPRKYVEAYLLVRGKVDQ
jgi:hypothetical protein